MNRDFEVRQLLRAYRSGLMSEAAFEEEITQLEHEASSPEAQQQPPPGFEAFGQRFRSERDAVLEFLDKLHATQMDAAVGFAKWAAVCRTNGLRAGLMIIAERDASHARALERRARELGGELHSTATEQGSKLVELMANKEIADIEKLVALTSLIQDPQEAIAPIVSFAQLLKKDAETKQALRLIAEDELSSTGWLRDVCGALANAQGK
ncbi:MAG TPA: hypothetical protein VMT61_05550 [Candidatus Binataceae bacterium]|nr:hypothetical protein [Candidatus Binataceae bacterium]